MMKPTPPANHEQSTAWNGASGKAWVETQALLDVMFAPFEDILVEAVLSADAGKRVLDVGCGTGGTTLALARRLGPEARCVGVDISDPMIALARERAHTLAQREGSQISFVRADAQRHAFEPSSFDMLASRFGVMFFDEPVLAFANMRQAVSSGGALRFMAWRSAAENPFMTAAEHAARPFMPERPARAPHAPGQFAFADRDHVAKLLEQSGWRDVDITPLDIACTLPEQDLMRYLRWLGPVGAFLQEADEQTRTQVLDAVRPAFDPYVHGREVRYDAACWMISARA